MKREEDNERSDGRNGGGPSVRINQVLGGWPAEVLLTLKREGFFRTTSQAINEAVLLLGERYAERKRNLEDLQDKQ